MEISAPTAAGTPLRVLMVCYHFPPMSPTGSLRVARFAKYLPADIAVEVLTVANPPEETGNRALLACDELTGFVGACALVRPDGIASLEPRSVLKKLKDKGFAAKVERHEIEEGARLLGVELPAHIGFVIGALTPHAAELLLQGRQPERS